MSGKKHKSEITKMSDDEKMAGYAKESDFTSTFDTGWHPKIDAQLMPVLMGFHGFPRLAVETILGFMTAAELSGMAEYLNGVKRCEEKASLLRSMVKVSQLKRACKTLFANTPVFISIFSQPVMMPSTQPVNYLKCP